MKNENEIKSDSIETLEVNHIDEGPKDIPTTFFKPIEEIQNQQETLIQSYEKDNLGDNAGIDLNAELLKLEKKLNQKRFYLPFRYTIIIVVLINIIWFLGVKFLIVPKYEDYVKQSEEIKANYDSLKRKVDAIVGDS